jgi:hypothetical protein
MGQLGSVFAEVLRGTDHDVVEVRRGDALDDLLADRALPDVIVVAVGEDALPAALMSLPPAHRARAVLVQNELTPAIWDEAGIADPTVAIVWFERKSGQPPRVILPTRVAGPNAVAIVEALDRAEIAADAIQRSELGTELVAKNAYILVTNVAGLDVGGTTGALSTEHTALRDTLLSEVIAVQRALVSIPFDADAARARAIEAMVADPAHVNAGRTAIVRAKRLLENAAKHRVDVPTVRAIVGRSSS